MRSIIVLSIIFAALSMSCSLFVWERPTLPVGTVACNADFQCPTNYICGFNGVDQVPHCIYKRGVSKDSE